MLNFSNNYMNFFFTKLLIENILEKITFTKLPGYLLHKALCALNELNHCSKMKNMGSKIGMKIFTI